MVMNRWHIGTFLVNSNFISNDNKSVISNKILQNKL